MSKDMPYQSTPKTMASSSKQGNIDESQEQQQLILKSDPSHDVIDPSRKSSESSSSSAYSATIDKNTQPTELIKQDDKAGHIIINTRSNGFRSRFLDRFTRSMSQQNDNSFSQESSLYHSMDNSSNLSDRSEFPSDSQIDIPISKQRSSSLSQNSSGNSTSLSCIDLSQYTPVEYHWFYCSAKEVDKNWLPFSYLDSKSLEVAYGDLQTVRLEMENESEEGNNLGRKLSREKYVIATDGGRYDVDLTKFTREAVYWRNEESLVRRCSWFYKKDGYSFYEPYDEDMCRRLEKYYKACAISNDWSKRYSLSEKELLIINGPTHFIHYDQCCKEEWLSMAENPYSPRQVHRGANEIFNIDMGEQSHDQIDHLIFFIHGVGGVCDVRFRSCVEVVNDFRKIANNLLASSSGGTITCDGTHVAERPSSSSSNKFTSPRTSTGQVRRIEFLPISWHSCTRREIGINDRLNQIALNSVPKLRQFLNKVIVDALLYASGPIYCQTIMDKVGNEVNRLYTLFCKRHPLFKGSVSLAGHSLGSLIVFDLLANQVSDLKGVETPSKYKDFERIEDLFNNLELSEYLALFEREKIDIKTLILLSDLDLKEMKLPLGVRRKLSTYINFKKMSLIPQTQQLNNSATPSSTAKISLGHIENMNTGQWMINYPQLKFKPRCFFAFGSPMSMFLTVRGMENINAEYKLPTCDKMLNIFHPYDPLAYRIEPLIDTRFAHIKPVLIPHHRGGKRMHLQLRDGFAKVGSDIKHRILDSLKSTWTNLSELTRFNTASTAGTQTSQTQSLNINEKEMTEISVSNSLKQDINRLKGSSDSDVTESSSISTSMDSDPITQEGTIRKINNNKIIKKSISDIGTTQRSPSHCKNMRKDEGKDMISSEDFDDAAFVKVHTSNVANENNCGENIPKNVGRLNEGRRLDFVLQEKPIEYMFNEYVFAFTSHASYWQNEDSAMMMLNEIYQADDIQMFDYFDGPNKATK